jgi:hypothetical protein
MASNKIDSRQITYRGVIDQLSNSNPSELDNLLRALGNQIVPLLRMSAQTTPSLVVSVGGSDLTDSESNRRRAIPHIGAAYVQFSSGTITFPAVSGGNITTSTGGSSLLTIASGNYAAVLVYLDGAGNLNTIVGTDAATEATAVTNLPPASEETLAIGFVVVHNVGGVIQNITQASIRQFGTGSGTGGSSGGLSENSISLRNTLDSSYLKYLSPSIFKTEKLTLIDTGSTTATYNLVSNLYEFAAAQAVYSVDLLDSSFYEESSDVDAAMFVVFWNNSFVDTAATYELSRDNGVTWQTVTMGRNGLTGQYAGVKQFSNETFSTAGTLTDSANITLNTTTVQQTSQRLVLTDNRVVNEFTFKLNKIGSPAGNLTIELVKDSGGNPSSSSADLISFVEKKITDISSGINNLVVDFGKQMLKAGTYHIVFKTDQSYKNSFSSGVTELAVRSNSAGSDPVAKNYNGSAWSDVVGQSIKFTYKYKVLKLLARITSSTTAKLEGFGVLYQTDDRLVSPVSYENIIVGTSAQVDAGLATHSSLQNALNDAGAGSSVVVLRSTLTGSVTWNQSEVLVKGEGRPTIIDGNLTISGSNNLLYNVKITGNLTVSGNYNSIRDCWIGGTITDSGTLNNFSVILDD